MLRKVRTIMTYTYASQSRKNLGLNLLLTAGRAAAVLDISFIAACFLILLIL